VKRWDNCWIQLAAGIVSSIVGVTAIVTRHIGRSMNQEHQATGYAAQVVGVLLIIMAAMILVDWVKKFRVSRK
jgi:hypothetical protein